ncbi:hypothetical protein AOLI_G00289010 [Acnodon oligacanthus]
MRVTAAVISPDGLEVMTASPFKHCYFVQVYKAYSQIQTKPALTMSSVDWTFRAEDAGALDPGEELREMDVLFYICGATPQNPNQAAEAEEIL